MTTRTKAPAPTIPLPAALLLPCPCCGGADAALSVRRGQPGDHAGDDDYRFVCGACGDVFTLGRLRDLVRAWLPVLNDWPAVRAWIGRAPRLSVVEEEDPEGWVEGEADEAAGTARRGRPRKPR